MLGVTRRKIFKYTQTVWLVATSINVSLLVEIRSFAFACPYPNPLDDLNTLLQSSPYAICTKAVRNWKHCMLMNIMSQPHLKMIMSRTSMTIKIKIIVNCLLSLLFLATSPRLFLALSSVL